MKVNDFGIFDCNGKEMITVSLPPGQNLSSVNFVLYEWLLIEFHILSFAVRCRHRSLKKILNPQSDDSKKSRYKSVN